MQCLFKGGYYFASLFVKSGVTSKLASKWCAASIWANTVITLLDRSRFLFSDQWNVVLGCTNSSCLSGCHIWCPVRTLLPPQLLTPCILTPLLPAFCCWWQQCGSSEQCHQQSLQHHHIGCSGHQPPLHLHYDHHWRVGLCNRRVDDL